MSLFARLLAVCGICILLCLFSFLGGMNVQSRISNQPHTHAFPKNDPYSMPEPYHNKIVSVHFDHNIIYPWSAYVMGNGVVQVPDNATAMPSRKPAVFMTLTATHETLIQSLKEQIQIDTGKIVNGELYDRSGKPLYVHAPEDPRIISQYPPQFLLDHVNYVWNYCRPLARCHSGERLLLAVIDPDKNTPQAGLRQEKRVYRNGFLNPVWQWKITDPILLK